MANEWLRLDPAAALRWVEGLREDTLAKKSGQDQPVWTRDSGYIQSEQPLAEQVTGWRDAAKNDLLRQWVHADPVAGFAATAATRWGLPFSNEGPGQPWNRPDDWIANSFSTFASLSSKLAAAAARSLPQERLTPAIATFLASPLENVEPGAGVEFAMSLPAGALRDAALSPCAFSVAERGEYREAIAIVQSIEDPDRRGVAAGSVMNSWAPVDPYSARSWLTELAPTLTPESLEMVTEAFVKKAKKCAPSLAEE